MKITEEDPIVTLQNLLNDPATYAKGEQHVRDIKYAIHLIEKHRAEKAELLNSLTL